MPILNNPMRSLAALSRSAGVARSGLFDPASKGECTPRKYLSDCDGSDKVCPKDSATWVEITADCEKKVGQCKQENCVDGYGSFTGLL